LFLQRRNLKYEKLYATIFLSQCNVFLSETGYLNQRKNVGRDWGWISSLGNFLECEKGITKKGGFRRGDEK